jgi:integrase
MNVSKDKKGRWTIDFRCKGRRITRIIGPSKREAEAIAATLKADILRDPYGFGRKKTEVLFEDHAKEYLELYSKQNKRSWKSDEGSLKHWTEFFRGKYLSEINPEAIEKYRIKRKVDGVSPSTVNRELACLKTLFNKAIEWEKTERNPAAKIKKFREPNPVERILSPDEMRRLIDEASPDLRPVLLIALNTGMRKGEILSLRWRAVDFVKGFILIEDSKSGKSRKVPTNGLIFDLLRDMKREGEFVFPSMDVKGQVRPLRDVKTAFTGACRRAEIKGLRFHDLRHTAASRMIEAGVDLVTVSKILGHASIQMTMRYCHPTEQNMRTAVGKLGEFFDKTGKKPETVEIRPIASSINTGN